MRGVSSVPERTSATVLQKMQKDLKIGLIVGLVIVSIAGLWLATRPSLTPQARLLDQSGRESIEPPAVGQGAPAPGSTQDRAAPPIRPTVATGGAGRSSMAAPAANVQPETIKTQRFHIVRDGQTLSEISYEYYGSATKWRKIFEANRGTIKNADVVRAGTKLIIPN